MFKLTGSVSGGTILVTDLDGNPVEPICRFAAYLLAKAYSPNTALAYARDLIHLCTFLSTQGIHWTSFSPELSAAFLGHLRSVPANRKRRDTSIRLVVSEGAPRCKRTVRRHDRSRPCGGRRLYRWAIFHRSVQRGKPDREETRSNVLAGERQAQAVSDSGFTAEV